MGLLEELGTLGVNCQHNPIYFNIVNNQNRFIVTHEALPNTLLSFIFLDKKRRDDSWVYWKNLVR